MVLGLHQVCIENHVSMPLAGPTIGLQTFTNADDGRSPQGIRYELVMDDAEMVVLHMDGCIHSCRDHHKGHYGVVGRIRPLDNHEMVRSGHPLGLHARVLDWMAGSALAGRSSHEEVECDGGNHEAVSSHGHVESHRSSPEGQVGSSHDGLASANGSARADAHLVAANSQLLSCGTR